MSEFLKYWQRLIGIINKLFAINAHNDFVELFFVKEAQELAGKNYKNFIFIMYVWNIQVYIIIAMSLFFCPKPLKNP